MILFGMIGLWVTGALLFGVILPFLGNHALLFLIIILTLLPVLAAYILVQAALGAYRVVVYTGRRQHDRSRAERAAGR
jgi:hypothetical protein